MRATLVVVLSASLFACRTSELGTCSKDGDCSAGAACDLAARVCVATDAPSFSEIAVSTPPGFTNSSGRAFFDTTGGSLAVSASITGRAGVDPATVCLTVTGETAACAHPGTAGTSNTFTFSLPRPSGNFDGAAPLDFTISASSPTARQSTSAVQHVYFDNQPPSIAVAADSTPFARALPDGGAAPITVSAIIADGTGVSSAQLISGSTQVAPSSSAGNEYTFHLNAAAAPPNMEGAYAFQVRAVDGLGHESTVDAARTIDDAPPAVGTIKIYKGDVEPGSAGVTYPPLMANTGWTGTTFIYNDTVHVKGTISDMSGIGPATLRVDGIDFSGGTSTGTAQTLGCTASSTTCSFNISVKLNDPQNGAFHTGVGDAGLPDGGAVIPSGFLHIVVTAEDNASAYGGSASHHAALPRDTAARATRLLWSAVLNASPNAAAVTGLAIHPDFDVIATTNGGTATLYSLDPDAGTIHWATDAGNVGGPLAIGTAVDGPVYTANTAGVITAFAMDGGVLWSKATTKAMSVGPAVAVATVGTTTVDQVLVADDVSLSGSSLWSVTAPGNIPVSQQQAADDRDNSSSPMVFDGGVWFGTSSSVDWHPLTSDGGIGPSVPIADSIGFPYFGTITDGANVFAASQNSPDLFKFTPTLGLLTGWPTTIANTLTGEMTIDIDGNLVGSDVGNFVRQYSRADGTTPGTPLATLAANGRIPLQGSDDHWYLPRATGLLLAFHQGQTSWTFDPPGTIFRGATIDCAGRLFVATSANSARPTVWAFITDDHGLADTAWPSWRRDSRNSGNADAPRYGILPASGSCTQ